MAIRKKTWPIHIASITQIPITVLVIYVIFKVNLMKTAGEEAFKMSICPNIQDQTFRNGDGRQSIKERHIAMQSTSQMCDP